MKLLWVFILGATIGGMAVQYKLTGNILSNEPKSEQKIEEKVEEIESRDLATPKERCYFTSTWGDITREKELNCAYYNKYYNEQFKTIHHRELKP